MHFAMLPPLAMPASSPTTARHRLNRPLYAIAGRHTEPTEPTEPEPASPAWHSNGLHSNGLSAGSSLTGTPRYSQQDQQGDPYHYMQQAMSLLSGSAGRHQAHLAAQQLQAATPFSASQAAALMTAMSAVESLATHHTHEQMQQGGMPMHQAFISPAAAAMAAAAAAGTTVPMPYTSGPAPTSLPMPQSLQEDVVRAAEAVAQTFAAQTAAAGTSQAAASAGRYTPPAAVFLSTLPSPVTSSYPQQQQGEGSPGSPSAASAADSQQQGRSQPAAQQAQQQYSQQLMMRQLQAALQQLLQRGSSMSSWPAASAYGAALPGQQQMQAAMAGLPMGAAARDSGPCTAPLQPAQIMQLLPALVQHAAVAAATAAAAPLLQQQAQQQYGAAAPAANMLGMFAPQAAAAPQPSQMGLFGPGPGPSSTAAANVPHHLLYQLASIWRSGDTMAYGHHMAQLPPATAAAVAASLQLPLTAASAAMDWQAAGYGQGLYQGYPQTWQPSAGYLLYAGGPGGMSSTAFAPVAGAAAMPNAGTGWSGQGRPVPWWASGGQ
jgi:hypothetical protein